MIKYAVAALIAFGALLSKVSRLPQHFDAFPGLNPTNRPFADYWVLFGNFCCWGQTGCARRFLDPTEAFIAPQRQLGRKGAQTEG